MQQNGEAFWNVPPPELLQQLQMTHDGLTSDEAQQRLDKYGFTHLPLLFLLLMGIIVVLYIVAAEVTKKMFYQRIRL